MTFKCFAYGSNMFLPKLRKVAPSASFYAIGKITGYELLFNKQSQDGSGKANIVKTGSEDDIVEGVIFEIDNAEQSSLDRSEGGYCPVEDIKIIVDNKIVRAKTYIARSNKIDDTLRPYDWYKEYVVRGAREYKLSENYTAFLQKFSAIKDVDRARVEEHQNILSQSY